MTPSTLIRNGLVVTMDDELGVLENSDVLLRSDGSIGAVGPSLVSEGATEIDATGSIVMPGFIDTHRHMFSGLARGIGDGVSYADYFENVVKGYAQAYEPEDTYVAVRLGMAEAVETGITTMHAWEHNLLTPDHATSSLRALSESGMRGRFSYGPPNVPMKLDPAHVLQMRNRDFVKSDRGGYFTPDGRIELGLATRGIELDDESIWIPELEFARAEGLPVTGHFMTTEQIEHVDATGALGPDLLGIHAIDATPYDLGRLAAAGTALSISHAGPGRAGVGWSDPVTIRNAGVKLCISLDSVAGADTGDFFNLMRLIVVATRALARDPGAYPVKTMLREATLGGAEALGIDDITGSLTPGKRADVIVIRTDTLNMTPLLNPVSQIVLSGQPRNVQHVWIDGVQRVMNGLHVDFSSAELIEQGRSQFRSLAARYGKPVV